MKIYYPGRFQPFHRSHLEFINQAVEYYKKKGEDPVVYFLVFNKKRIDGCNPFNYKEITEIINSYNNEFNFSKYYIKPLTLFFPITLVFYNLKDKINREKNCLLSGDYKSSLYKIIGCNICNLENVQRNLDFIHASDIRSLIKEKNYKEARRYVNDFTLEKLIEKSYNLDFNCKKFKKYL